MAAKHKVPFSSLQGYLSGYRARLEREYSTNNKHIYFSRPLQRWIVVQKRGNMAELEFLDYCPCGADD